MQGELVELGSLVVAKEWRGKGVGRCARARMAVALWELVRCPVRCLAELSTPRGG